MWGAQASAPRPGIRIDEQPIAVEGRTRCTRNSVRRS